MLLFSLFNHTVVSDSTTRWTIAHQAPLSSIISQSFLKSLSQRCYLAISSSTTPISFCLQSFSVSGSESESCSVVSRLFAAPWTVHGFLQARILEWVAFPFSRGSSQPRDGTQVSCIAGGFLTSWATGKPKNIGVGSLSCLQQIFLAQESNQGLLHCRQSLYQLSYKGSPLFYWVCSLHQVTKVLELQLQH